MNYYLLDKRQLSEGVNRCIEKTERLLNNALVLIDEGKDITHAMGLYTFAIEEYGKALLLKECSLDPDGKYRVPVEIFTGRESHKLKFHRGNKDLPEECKIFGFGVKIDSAFTATTVITFKGGSHAVSIIPGATGFFVDSSPKSVEDSVVDFIVRTECFYVDWDDEKKRWKNELTVSKDELLKATRSFKEHLVNIKIG